MSAYDYFSCPETLEPVLKPRSHGWGWPRLVDVPKANRPFPIRATSVQSHSGVILSADGDPRETRILKRASSLKSHIPSIVITQADPHNPPSVTEVAGSADLAHQAASAVSKIGEAPETAEDPRTAEALETAPIVIGDILTATTSSEPQPGLEITSSPTLESSLTGGVESAMSTAESETTVSPALLTDPVRKDSTPLVTLLLAEITPTTSSDVLERQCDSKPDVCSSPDPTIPPVSQSSQAPKANVGSYFEPAAIASAALEIGSVSSSTSSNSGGSFPVPRESPRPFPIFRELPSETDCTAVDVPSIPTSNLPVTRIEIAEPFNGGRLPRPKIVIIRATEDRSENTFATRVEPDLSEEAYVVAQAPKAGLSSNSPLIERILGGIPMPELRLPETSHAATGLAPDDFGAVANVNVTKPRRVKRRSRMIRKTRKGVLRSPVLAVILGRQLAVVTLPALRIIADGCDPHLTEVRGETR
ncbi:hypothetical protein MMC13_007167 [Lambiella insularis]|nr:hypothetical protein [Lambiella insularis]